MAETEGGEKKTIGQRAKEIGKGAVARMYGTTKINPWRKERLKKISDEDKSHDEEVREKARLKVRKENEGKLDDKDGEEVEATPDQKEGKKTAKNVKVAQGFDADTAQGNSADILNKALIHAIVHGQRRTTGSEEATPESIMRQVVTQPQFIAVIKAGMVKTPVEMVNEDYRELPESMPRERKELVEQLVAASNDPEHLIKKLSLHQLDIIYSTLMCDVFSTLKCDPKVWDSPEVVHHRSPFVAEEKGKKAKKGSQPQDTEGKICSPWDPNIPKPDEAFFRFLKNVAKREKPGEEGDFISNSIKYLGTHPTFTKMGDETLNYLIDLDSVKKWVGNNANPPFESAVKEFANTVFDIVTSSKTVLRTDSDVGVIGCGYPRVTMEMLQAKKDRYDEMKRTHAIARGNQQKAINELNNANDAKTTAEAQLAAGKQMLVQASGALKAADERMAQLKADVRDKKITLTKEEAAALVGSIEAERKAANEMGTSAQQAIATSTAGIAKAELDIQVATTKKEQADTAFTGAEGAMNKTKKELEELVMMRRSVDVIVHDLAEDFRIHMTSATEGIGTIPTKMQNKLVNKELMTILGDDKIARLCELMDEVAMHYPPEDTKTAAKANIAALLETAASYEKMGKAEEAGAYRAEAKRYEEERLHDEERKKEERSFEHKRIEFDGTDSKGELKDATGGRSALSRPRSRGQNCLQRSRTA